MKHCFWILLLLCQTAWGVDYDYVFVRSQVPAGRMAVMPAGSAPWATEESKLWLHRQGQVPELLYDPGPGKAITDKPAYRDGWVYFTQVDGLPAGFQMEPQVVARMHQRSRQGADIYRINLATRAVEKPTDQTPLPFAGEESRNYPASNIGAGPFNVMSLGPCPLPGGKLLFVSDREIVNQFQTYIRHPDGRIEKTGYLHLANALNPILLSNGYVMLSQKENQGLRSDLPWSLWRMLPDGRNWGPEVSAFNSFGASSSIWKFHTEARTSDGQRVIVTTLYYGQGSNGFGTFWRFPLLDEGQQFTHIKPANWESQSGAFFTKDMLRLTPWANSGDRAATTIEQGKIGHPAPARPGFVLCSWSPGPVYQFAPAPANGVWMDSGIYLLPIDAATTGPSQLIKVWDEPGWNEYFPEPILSDKEKYGREIPDLSFLPPPTDARLLPGEPAGLIGTSSFYNRESKALQPAWNWIAQGSDAGEYPNSEIHAVRIVSMEVRQVFGATKQRTALKQNELLRVLAEIPLRKFNADGTLVLDPDGNPDTSFLAKIPADVPFTFQTVDKFGRVLNMAQTWHQLRPGEERHDCGGCHAHTQNPTNFADTAAGRPGFAIADFFTNSSPPKLVEFNRDVKPIFAKHGCANCHDGTDPGAPVWDFVNWYGGDPNGQQYANKIKPIAQPYQSRTSKLTTHLRSGTMPKNAPPLSEDEVKAVELWLDLGLPIGDDCHRDHTKPSVAIAGGFAGAFDHNLASVLINGQQVSTTNGRWPVSGMVEIVATDKTGNVARLTREAGAAPPPAPKTLEERVEDLERRVDAIERDQP